MNGNVAFSYEIIRDYLIGQGGKVEYHKLIKHFKDALANPENKGKEKFALIFKPFLNLIDLILFDQNSISLIFNLLLCL